jgi:hypothetical protein
LINKIFLREGFLISDRKSGKFPTLQNMKFLNIFLFVWVIVASRSDSKHWVIGVKVEICHSRFPGLGWTGRCAGGGRGFLLPPGQLGKNTPLRYDYGVLNTGNKG